MAGRPCDRLKGSRLRFFSNHLAPREETTKRIPCSAVCAYQRDPLGVRDPGQLKGSPRRTMLCSQAMPKGSGSHRREAGKRDYTTINHGNNLDKNQRLREVPRVSIMVSMAERTRLGSVVSQIQESSQALARRGMLQWLATCIHKLTRVSSENPTLPFLLIFLLIDFDNNGYTPLMFAARENKALFIDRLVDLGCNPNAKNKDGFTPIHLAAMYSKEDTIRHLIQKKADINATGGQRDGTAAHLVAGRSTGAAVSMMKMILMHSRHDLRLVKDSRGDIPLFISVDAGHQGLVKELLFHHGPEQVKQMRAHTRDTALHIAARRKDTDLVRILIDAGSSTDVKNAQGQTVLHITAEEADDHTMKYLYTVHVNPNQTDNHGDTKVDRSTEKGNTPAVDLLADKFKASVMERTKDGSTLVHIASLHGHPDTVMSFLRKGVPLHMPNREGARCIHTAAQRGHVGVVNAIINKGEHVDAKTNDGFTAMHIAVRAGKPAVVESLLGWGGNLTIQGGPARESALHLAARVKDGEKCAEMLLKSGADPNLPKDDGQTPLHLAAGNNNLRTLKLLLEDGAKATITSKSGETPLHLACASFRVDAAKMIINHVTKKGGKDAVTRLVNTKNLVGESTLHYIGRQVPSDAAKTSGDDKELARLLLSNGGDMFVANTKNQENPIHYVSKSGNEAVLEEMLHFTSPEKIQQLVNAQTTAGWSPLLVASDKGHTGVVTTLLDNQARVDVFDTEGKAALHLAAEHGYKEVCDALLSHKAFVNARSITGLTALHLASLKGHNELVYSLITQHRAQKEALTLSKQTPLHLAAVSGQLEVCETLLKLGADTNATTDEGQKAIHLAAIHNNSQVVTLFLKTSPELVTTTDKDGNTCAHIAALQGSVDVVRELMGQNRGVVINGRNRTGQSMPIHMAAEGGHARLVRFLVENGASPKAEDGAGFTPIHLAARYGHLEVLDVLRQKTNLGIISRKLGLSALHIAAYYGQTEIVRELLTHIPAYIKSEPPSIGAGSRPFLPDLGAEADLTPLHLASHEGNEGVVRILFNSPNVLPDVKSRLHGYIPLHLACSGGHTSVVGLLLSKSTKQVEMVDKRGRRGVHIAAQNGHRAMHNDVYSYLINKKHDSYKLLEDRKNVIIQFVHDLTLMSKKHDDVPLEEYVLRSPAPVDIATKLSHTLAALSEKEKESARDLVEAAEFSEKLGTELMSISANLSSPGLILRAVDNRNITLLDSLIEHSQKEVIAHPAVQRYLDDVWKGSLNWPTWKTISLFFAFLFLPPVWIFFSLPLGHKYNEVPMVKFAAYLVSHLYLLILYFVTVVTPLSPIWELIDLIPRWYWNDITVNKCLVQKLIKKIESDEGLKYGSRIYNLVFPFFIVLIDVVIIGHNKLLVALGYLRTFSGPKELILRNIKRLESYYGDFPMKLFCPWSRMRSKIIEYVIYFLIIFRFFIKGLNLIYISRNHKHTHPIFEVLIDDKVGLICGPIAVGGSFVESMELVFVCVFSLVYFKYVSSFYALSQWVQCVFSLMYYKMTIPRKIIVILAALILFISSVYYLMLYRSSSMWK
ncbi:unnamed protein product, partial [Meganyctiphanes norvegica]